MRSIFMRKDYVVVKKQPGTQITLKDLLSWSLLAVQIGLGIYASYLFTFISDDIAKTIVDLLRW
ncbi:hypothetical protein [Chengkuizengella marina]|uniref:Uncharacterized protein n=1 Tax=Chengkuizengella marina TaxID=2507566 RepID=A0A6N9PYM1_9BACL|nr:hypothetical protein [Chengkuizengella marina]NBI28621.1 hypothetical protein [Chengkuizengella marina]